MAQCARMLAIYAGDQTELVAAGLSLAQPRLRREVGSKPATFQPDLVFGKDP